MRLGLWGARGDFRGLAVQTLEVARHMHPTKIMCIDVGELSPHRNNWTPFVGLGAHVQLATLDQLTDDAVRAWLEGVDVVYAAETAYDPQRPATRTLWELARDAGVRTVLHANPELCPWSRRPDDPRPDVLAVPTTWRMDAVPDAVLLPWPTSPERFAPEVRGLRESAWTFLHQGGWPAMRDRAGTSTVVQALQHVSERCAVRLRIQRSDFVAENMRFPPNLRVSLERRLANDWEYVYWPADVLIAPRAYGGLSLPLWEALAAGIPAIVIDREPDATLPGTMALTADQVDRVQMQGGAIDCVSVSPHALADVMDAFVRSPELVTQLSEAALAWGQENSWDHLRLRWEGALCGA